MKIRMKKDVTRKQFEKCVLSNQLKNMKFGYTRIHNKLRYTPAHSSLEFVLPQVFHSDIIMIKGVTYIFITCEGIIDLTELFSDPEKKGTLFVIEKGMTVEEAQMFFEKFLNSQYMINIMNEMRKNYEESLKAA